MTVDTYSQTDGAKDGHDSGTITYVDSTYLHCQVATSVASTGRSVAGLQFLLDVPAGSTINSASLTIYCQHTSFARARATIRVEDDPTTSYVAWGSGAGLTPYDRWGTLWGHSSDTGALEWDYGTAPDTTTALVITGLGSHIQALVDDPAYDELDDTRRVCAVYLKGSVYSGGDSTSFRFRPRNEGTTYDPELTVDYTEPGGGQMVTPALFTSSTAAFPTPTTHQPVVPTPLALTISLPTPYETQIKPTLGGAITFPAPTINGAGASVSPALFASSTASFPAPTVTVESAQTVSPAVFVSASAVFPVPALTVEAAQTVSPAAYTSSTVAFPVPTVTVESALTVTPAAFTSTTATFPTPTVTVEAAQTVTPAAFANVSTFPVPSISTPGPQTVTPARFISSTAAFPAPSLGQVVAPTVFASGTASFPTPAVTVESAQTVTPAAFANGSSFPAPTITQAGPQTVTPAAFTNPSASFPVPTVTPASSPQTVNPAAFTSSTVTFPAPTVTVESAQTVTPARFVHVATFPAPTVVTTQTVTPALFLNPNLFPSPDVGDWNPTGPVYAVGIRRRVPWWRRT